MDGWIDGWMDDRNALAAHPIRPLHHTVERSKKFKILTVFKNFFILIFARNAWKSGFRGLFRSLHSVVERSYGMGCESVSVVHASIHASVRLDTSEWSVNSDFTHFQLEYLHQTFRIY